MIISSTLSDNSGIDGGGIYSSGAVSIANTIIANSPFGGDCSGSGFASLGHNLDSDGTCNLTEPTDLPNTDPLLGPLQNNGGPTFTHALLPGSPAIGAGDPAELTGVDQRGFDRGPSDGISIGAYEFAPLTEGLVHRWSAEGDANESIGGHDGTLLNGAGFAEGVSGQAFSFDGVDDFVVLAEHPHVGEEFSISVWVKLDASGFDSYNSIFSSTPIFLIQNGSSQGNELEFGAGGNIFTSSPPANTWTHIVGVREPTSLRIYVNGMLGTTEAASSPVGQTSSFTLTDPYHAGASYAVLASLSGGGYSNAFGFGTRAVPIVVDAITLLSLMPGGGGVFAGYLGQLDSNGTAQLAMLVPYIPPLIGLELTQVGVTIDAAAPSGVAAITPPLRSMFVR